LSFSTNVQYALAFLWIGAAPAFELSGIAGRTMVQGMGILFCDVERPLRLRSDPSGQEPYLAAQAVAMKSSACG
jgi:hypothetical protein